MNGIPTSAFPEPFQSLTHSAPFGAIETAAEDIPRRWPLTRFLSRILSNLVGNFKVKSVLMYYLLDYLGLKGCEFQFELFASIPNFSSGQTRSTPTTRTTLASRAMGPTSPGSCGGAMFTKGDPPGAPQIRHDRPLQQ